MKLRWIIRKGVGRIETGKPFMGVAVESINRYGSFVQVRFSQNRINGRPPLVVTMTEIESFCAE